MRILAMSDLHGFPAVHAAVPVLAGRHAVDAVVLAGDLLRGIEGRGSREEGFRASAAELTRALAGLRVPVLYVMGNDDLVDWEPRLPGFEPLHLRRVEAGGWNFVGYACTLPFMGGARERPEEAIAADLRGLESLVDGRTVLVTHGPVHGILDRTILGHAGSRSLAALVSRRGPRAHVHGHVHESFGREGRHFNVASGGRVRGMVIDLDTLAHAVVGE